MLFLDHIWLIPLLPAFGAAMMFFFGRRLQKATVDAVCVGVVVLAFLFACFTVVEYTHFAHGTGRPFEKIVYTWLGSGDGHLNFVKRDGTPASFNADAGFLLDPLSSIWLLFVTGVGMLIHIYSTGYMAHEGGYYRFFGYMNLFMFSMLTLILANNYMLLFVGWEGVGLCSYLLIGFYFHRKSNWRCRFPVRDVFHCLVFRLATLHGRHSTGAQRAIRNRRSHYYCCDS